MAVEFETVEAPFCGVRCEATVQTQGQTGVEMEALTAVQIALRCEAAALGTSRRITNSEGAGVSAQQSHFFTEHMRGGERGRPGVFKGG